MKFLDKFKKGKKVVSKEKKEPIKEEKTVKETKEKKVEPKVNKDDKVNKVDKVNKRRIGVNTHQLLKEIHITEKVTDLGKNNQYVFKVYPRGNKTEIKKAIEDLYGVNVLKVRTIKISPKKRKMGKIEGFRKGYKKAIIEIKKGQKIEVLPR